MIFLYIIAGIIALTGLILLLFIKIEADFNAGLIIRVKIAFLKFTVYDSEKPKKPDDENKPQTNKKLPYADKIKDNFKNISSSGEITEIFTWIKKLLQKLGKSIIFFEVDLHIIAGGKDPAETAIKYGALCASVYPLISYADSLGNINNKNVTINCGFNQEATEVKGKITAGMRIWTVFSILFMVIKFINKK